MRAARGFAVLVVLALLVSLAPLARADQPSPVANVQGTVSNGSLTLSWTPPSYTGKSFSGSSLSITEYYVWLSSAGQSGLGPSCTTQTTSCTISGLENGTDYWAEIKAYNSSYYFSYAGPFGPWKPCCEVPDPPSAVSASAGDGTASVTWSAPANASSTGGSITYAVTSSPAGLTCSTTGLRCDFTGLANGTSYSFSVVASTRFGSGRAGTSNAVTPLGLPGAPTGVEGFLGGKGSVTVTWFQPDNTGGTSISEYVATATPGGANCTTAELSCDIVGLKNGQSYTFAVVATNSVGSGPSSAASPVARPLAGPGAPRFVKATRKGMTAAVVRWKPPASTGGLSISKYLVTAQPGGRACSTRRQTCVLSGLRRGVTYSFRVQAFNAKGEGLPGLSNRVTMPAPPPPPEPTPATPTPAPVVDPGKPQQSLT